MTLDRNGLPPRSSFPKKSFNKDTRSLEDMTICLINNSDIKNSASNPALGK